jgi:hypothetical protein
MQVARLEQPIAKLSDRDTAAFGTRSYHPSRLTYCEATHLRIHARRAWRRELFLRAPGK